MNGNYLKVLIISKGYTIKALSEEIGINNMTLTNWINNRNTQQLNNFIDLLNLLQCTQDDITKLKE